MQGTCGNTFGNWETVPFSGTIPNITTTNFTQEKCYQFSWQVTDDSGTTSFPSTVIVTTKPNIIPLQTVSVGKAIFVKLNENNLFVSLNPVCNTPKIAATSHTFNTGDTIELYARPDGIAGTCTWSADNDDLSAATYLDTNHCYIQVYPTQTTTYTVTMNGCANTQTQTLELATSIPSFTYTGNYQIIDDENGNWRIKFFTSGTLTFTQFGTGNGVIDVFLVGGGGAGGAAGSGGGGGYTGTFNSIVTLKNTAYTIVVGAGGTRGSSGSWPSGNAGGSTSAFASSVNGGIGGKGYVSTTWVAGGAGGSGGGSSNADYSNTYGGTGGGQTVLMAVAPMVVKVKVQLHVNLENLLVQYMLVVGEAVTVRLDMLAPVVLAVAVLELAVAAQPARTVSLIAAAAEAVVVHIPPVQEVLAALVLSLFAIIDNES